MPFGTKTTKFDSLLSQVPKYPEVWNSEDVAVWLSLIGMEGYVQNFEAMSIDGLLIFELTEEDLEKELQITTKLHRKKIIKAIELLRQYDSYLKQLADDSNTEAYKKRNMEGDDMVKEEMMTADHHMGGRSPRANRAGDLIVEEEARPQAEGKPKSDKIITIKSIEGPSDMNFMVDSCGTKIGRHSSNQIVIFDESVSRYHAEIIFNDDLFYLYDVGSTTGTFLKITEPLELKHDMIIEVGSYQLQVTNLVISEDTTKDSFVEFTISESPEELLDRTFMLFNNNSIGRKSNNSISFTDDLHMSNLHCKVYLVHDKFLLEDIESTNGTWFRLSPESVRSIEMPLKNKMVFKIGNSAMYEVEEINTVKSADVIVEEKPKHEMAVNGITACIICWEGERDCVILPCRHNVTCMKCIKSVKVCPLCRTHIDDLYRIYKC